jgi:hypothetical protein
VAVAVVSATHIPTLKTSAVAARSTAASIAKSYIALGGSAFRKAGGTLSGMRPSSKLIQGGKQAT